MNNIERLQKLAGITITEAAAFGEKKYADRDKAGLLAVQKELKAVMLNSARASFKYKNAAEELKVVDSCIKKLEEPEKKEVKESTEEVETVIEAKDDDKKDDDKKEDKKDDDKSDKDSDDKKDDKKDDDDKPAFLKKDSDKDDDKEKKKDKSDKKDDDKDSDKKDDKKSDDKEDKKDDDKPDFLKKKDDKDSDKKDDKDSDDKEDKKDDKKDDDKDEKTVKVEVKVEETVEDIVARILEKETDLTPTKVEVDYENGPTENSGIKFEQGTKIRLPNAVKAELKKRIAELDNAILRYDDKGYDDKSIKQQAVDCLNQILQDLSTNDLEGVKKAQIYLGTLMSPLTDFFPPQIINWLANATNPYVSNDAEQ